MYKDYPADKIAAKLKQVQEYEAKYGESTRTIAYKKWCTDYDYRKREWEWRQAVARAHGKESLIDGFGQELYNSSANY